MRGAAKHNCTSVSSPDANRRLGIVDDLWQSSKLTCLFNVDGHFSQIGVNEYYVGIEVSVKFGVRNRSKHIMFIVPEERVTDGS